MADSHLAAHIGTATPQEGNEGWPVTDQASTKQETNEVAGFPVDNGRTGLVDEFEPQHTSRLKKMNEARLRSYGCVVHDGIVYNKNGYRVCGVMNQHDKPCQRIGHCPFHNTGSKDGAPQRHPGWIANENVNPEEAEDDQEEGGGGSGANLPPKKVPYKKGWTKEEHYLFLRGLAAHGRGAWKQIAAIVSSRTPTQIQSHAQKYFLRQKQRMKNKRSIHDLNLNSPEMVELAAKWNVQSSGMNYNEATQMSLPNNFGNEIIPGVHPPTAGARGEAGNPGSSMMYHPYAQESQMHSNMMYPQGSQGMVQYPMYPYTGMSGMQAASPEDGLDQSSIPYMPMGASDSRPAPYIITR